MSTETVAVAKDERRADAVDALERPTVLRGVTYGMYVRLRKDPRNDHFRMTYYDGTLELMSPELLHERPSRRLGVLVLAIATALRIPYQGTGSTTIQRGDRKFPKGKGKEPDQGFYFAHLGAIAGKDRINLDVDPPPDLWIEVDNRGSSKGRLPVYAELGVPEVWRYRARGGKLWFGRLENGSYITIDRSLSLPMLTPELVRFALARHGRDEGAWVHWLWTWAEGGMPTGDPAQGPGE